MNRNRRTNHWRAGCAEKRTSGSAGGRRKSTPFGATRRRPTRLYTKLAEYAFERDGFLLLAKSEEEAPSLHHRFLDRRSPLPLHASWADWLWRRALAREEAVPLQSEGVVAYRCDPDAEALRDDLSVAVASGLLTLPREDPSIPTTQQQGENQ